jgi:hypothetical protein
MSQSGKWFTGSANPVDTLTGNIGGPVAVDASNNIDIVGVGPISIAGNPATHTLTISANILDFTWVQQAVSLNPIVKNTAYITIKNGLCDLTLPALPTLGDTFKVTTYTGVANMWQISLNTGTLYIAGLSSIVGVASSTVGDYVEIVCINGGINPIYRITDFTGNIVLL